MMLAISGGSSVPAACAEPPEALDADFLDYLVACEGKDDNWTVVAGEKLRKKAGAKQTPKEEPPADAAKQPEARP